MSHNKKRIEPSFSVNSVELSQQHQNDSQTNSHAKDNSQPDESTSFKEILLNTYLPKLVTLTKKFLRFINDNRKVSAYVSAVIVLLIIIITLFYSGDSENLAQQNPNILEQENTNIELSISAGLHNTQHRIAFQDNFSLMITAYQGIVINWQGEHAESPILWDIRRTTGNQTCQFMQFNNKVNYPTFSVIKDEMKGYLAYFSPLDSENIIKSLARKNTFTLCGYEFSLTGSQALLGKHAFYSNFLSE